MAGPVSATAVGIGVTLGILVTLVLIIFVGMVISGIRSSQDRHRLLEHRRTVLRARRQEEQRQWRERRLRDVVLLLVERGEVMEGIPLAAQLPGKNEVSCRRQLRRTHEYNVREEVEDELREESEAQLPEEIRRVMYQSLPELLAQGRPPDAERGPDIMQLLLDGQEPRQLSSSNAESDSEWTSTASPTPAVTAQSLTADGNTNNAVATQSDAAPSPATARDPHAQWEATRQEAIIRELHAERDRKRRRRDAEEVYGVGYEYVDNPYNITHVDTAVGDLAEMQPQSPLRRFLSPLSPFRAKRCATSSAFEDRSSSVMHPISDSAGNVLTANNASCGVAEHSQGAVARQPY